MAFLLGTICGAVIAEPLAPSLNARITKTTPVSQPVAVCVTVIPDASMTAAHDNQRLRAGLTDYTTSQTQFYIDRESPKNKVSFYSDPDRTAPQCKMLTAIKVLIEIKKDKAGQPFLATAVSSWNGKKESHSIAVPVNQFISDGTLTVRRSPDPVFTYMINILDMISHDYATKWMREGVLK